MTDQEKIQKFKKTLADAQSEKDRNTGLLEGAMRRLKDQYGLSSVDEIKARIAELDELVPKVEAEKKEKIMYIEREFIDLGGE